MKYTTTKVLRLALLITLVAALFIVPGASAQGIVYGDSVPKGTVLERNAILIGNIVTIDGEVEGDVIAIGTSVLVRGTIKGSLVSVGQSIDVDGNITGSTYAASLIFQAKEATQIVRDLYYLGGQLVTLPGSQVGRDIYAITFGATLTGEVGRDLHAIIGPVEIVSAVMQAINGTNLRDLLPRRLSPGSALEIVAAPGAQSFLAGSANRTFTGVASDLGNLPFIQEGPLAAIDWASVEAWSLARLQYLVILFIFGGLALLISRRWFEAWAKHVRTAPLASLAWGLVVLAFGFVASGLVMILLIPVAIFLANLSLGSVAVIVLALGYSILLFVFTFFLTFVLYISKAVVAYMLSKLFLQRVAPRLAKNRFFTLFLGLFVYVLIVSIPTVGWVIGMIVTLFGLGGIWMATRKMHIALSIGEREQPG